MTVAIPDDAGFSHALVVLLARSQLTMNDVMNARAMIETRLVPLGATRGTKEDWKGLRGIYETFAAAVDSGDWDLVGEAHLKFHVGLLKAIHQPALEIFLKPMTEIIMISAAPPRLGVKEAWVKKDWEVESHLPVIEALEAADAARVEAAMCEHFAATTDPKRYRRFRARRFDETFAARLTRRTE